MTAVVKAEASICTVRKQHIERAIKLWINLCTLPDLNPLSQLNTTMFQRFTSSLQRITYAHWQTSTGWMKTIHFFAIASWKKHFSATIDLVKDKIIDSANVTQGIWIATSSSERKAIVRIRVAIYDTLSIVMSRQLITQSVTVASRLKQNSYTAELTAIATDIKCLPLYLIGRQITIFISNQGTLLAATQLKQQSGQTSIKEIYKTLCTLWEEGNSILIV